MRTVFFLSLILVFFAAVLQVHIRLEAIRLAYEIGLLKEQEANLVEKKNQLSSELAELTTFDALKSRIAN